MKRHAGRLGVVLGLGLVAASVHAQSSFKGEADLQSTSTSSPQDSLDAALGERTHWDQDALLRLMWDASTASGWGIDVAYLGTLRQGGGVALSRREYAAFPGEYVDPDRVALLRLQQTLTDAGTTLVAQRFDRLALTYSTPHLVLRFGRQALTWGSGLVFHPMDLFNPFPPNATYTTYKPGADMAYGQWLFDSGADVQVVVAPRRDPVTGHYEPDQSSAGIKWHFMAGAEQQYAFDLLLAQDYGAQVVGAGAGGALGGASWTAEVVPTRLASGGTRVSALANLQYAWTWGTRDVSGFLEYYRNGFGLATSGTPVSGWPAPLAQRLARGEIFTVARDSLASGLSIQWTPLLTLKPTLIMNLDDGSALLVGQLVYSLSQNTALTAGMQWGHGGAGAEYGSGAETAVGSGIFLTVPMQVYARLTWYF